MVGVFLFIPLCIYTLLCIINASTLHLTLSMTFIFPTVFQHLSCLSMYQFISYFSPYSQHPLSPSLSSFTLDHFPTSLQSSPLSFLPHSISLPPLLLSSLPPSLLPQHWPPAPPPSPSPVSKAVYRQLQSHLSVQFIFPCSLWGKSKRKNHKLPS